MEDDDIIQRRSKLMKKTLPELREIARNLSIKGVSRLNKELLIMDIIYTERQMEDPQWKLRQERTALEMERMLLNKERLKALLIIATKRAERAKEEAERAKEEEERSKELLREVRAKRRGL